MASLWQNGFMSDVQLQLRTQQVVPATPQEPPARTSSTADGGDDGVAGPEDSGAGEGRRARGSSKRAAGDPEQSGRGKVPRRSEGGAASPAAEAAPGTAAVMGPGPGSAAAAAPPEDCGGRTLQLHANILASSSAYFMARLDPGGEGGLRYADGISSSSGNGGGGGGGGRGGGGAAVGAVAERPVTSHLLVEHLEEAELPAMEAVLRHCYTGKLCADDARPGVAMLLQMLVLSDRFDVPLCAAHCGRELATRVAPDFDVAAINFVTADSGAGWRSSASFPRILAAATEQLLALLGNSELVCAARYSPGSGAGGRGGTGSGGNGSSTNRIAQLQQLTLASFLVLLSSPRLTARSENAVLLMADHWVTGGATAGATAQPIATAAGAATAAAAAGGAPRRSDAELRQLRAALGLCRLSHAYLVSVAPHLPWLALTAAEHMSLLQFLVAADRFAAPGEPSSKQLTLTRRGTLLGPPAWYVTQPRPVPDSQWQEFDLFDWGISAAAVLRPLLRQAAASPDGAVTFSPEHSVNGFAVRCFLRIPPAGAAAPGDKVWLGHVTCVDVPGLAAVTGRGEAPPALVHTTIWPRLPSRPLSGARMISGACEGGEQVDVQEVTLLGPPLEYASWGGRVVDGELKICCELRSCE